MLRQPGSLDGGQGCGLWQRLMGLAVPAVAVPLEEGKLLL